MHYPTRPPTRTQSHFLQAIAAAVAFWAVGVPLSWYLGVHLRWGVKGLWGGLAIAEGPLFFVYLFLLG